MGRRAPKARRGDAESIEGVWHGEGCPHSQPTRGSGEHHKLSQRSLGHSPGWQTNLANSKERIVWCISTWHTDSLWKQFFVVYLYFNPFHQQLNVLHCRQLRWLLVIDAIAPIILIPVNIVKSRTCFSL